MRVVPRIGGSGEAELDVVLVVHCYAGVQDDVRVDRPSACCGWLVAELMPLLVCVLYLVMEKLSLV